MEGDSGDEVSHKREKDVKKEKKKEKKEKKKKEKKERKKKRQREEEDQDDDQEVKKEQENVDVVGEVKEDEEEEEGDDKKKPFVRSEMSESKRLALEARRRRKLLSARDKMPEFMREGVVIGDDQIAFDQLALSSIMVNTLRDNGFVNAFAVQRALIPFFLRESRFVGGDALVMSATGSGKTLAFAVPIVELLLTTGDQRLQCICIVPTKDIAAQVHEVFCALCDATDERIRSVLLAGDRSFFEDCQTLMKVRPQIVVVTPGRLRDHLLGEYITADALKQLRWLVMDEGDKLLSRDYRQWLQDVMPHLVHPVDTAEGPFGRPPLQKVVFSATMTSNPRKLALLKLYRPTFFHALDLNKTIAHGSAVLPATLKEYRVECRSEEDRPLVLLWIVEKLIPSIAKRGALVFLNSVDRAHVLYDVLNPICSERGVTIALYTSRVRPKERATALSNFKEGTVDCLIVTDVLARGIDVLNIAVINYDCPFRSETYVHRAGRSARAGRDGEVYTIGMDLELVRWKEMRSAVQGGCFVPNKQRVWDKDFAVATRSRLLEEFERLKRQKQKGTFAAHLARERQKKNTSMPVSSNADKALEILQAQLRERMKRNQN